VTADRASEAVSGDAAFDIFIRLDTAHIALLLDFDGTLVEIANTPDAVHVPDDLRTSLPRLLHRTGGALAVVSGRPVADLDRHLAPLVLPTIGGHGAEMRVRDGAIERVVAPLPEALRRRLAEARAFDPGIVIEDKAYSVALHYRQAPQQEERLRRHAAAVRAAFPGENIEVLPGKAMLEVKRSGVSKGEAVRALMMRAPFAGRKPVFIGDDVTDESVFARLPELGGIGFSVGREFAGLAGVFSSPAQFRRALQALAAN
jgi:trehalose 6-phosphate phosphatase